MKKFKLRGGGVWCAAAAHRQALQGRRDEFHIHVLQVRVCHAQAGQALQIGQASRQRRRRGAGQVVARKVQDPQQLSGLRDTPRALKTGAATGTC